MAWLAWTALFTVGCAVSQKRVVPTVARPAGPALEASRQELLERYNRQAGLVRSINASVEIAPVAGSAYSGVIEDYREIRGFVLAQRPASIRMIGQAPVVAKNIFDMVSDGETFRIFIPSKNKFVVGPAQFERRSERPIENLRPQHLLEALFWEPVAADAPALIEEADVPPASPGTPPERYYVLTILRRSGELEIARKVWFDRTDLHVARLQVYGAGGRVTSDITYADWMAAPAPIASGRVPYPWHIRVARPREDYQLTLRITKMWLNENIIPDRFELAQPPGTELVRVSEAAPAGKGERP